MALLETRQPVVVQSRKSGGSKKGRYRGWSSCPPREAAALLQPLKHKLTGKAGDLRGLVRTGQPSLNQRSVRRTALSCPVHSVASHIPSVQIGQMYFQERRF